MITDSAQLEAALCQLRSLGDMLEAMRLHLLETNPSFFPVASESYLNRLRELQSEVTEYLLLHTRAGESGKLTYRPGQRRVTGALTPLVRDGGMRDGSEDA